MKHISAAAISMALSIFIASSAPASPLLETDRTDTDFSLFFSGPGVEIISQGDEYSEYQWALRNTGNLQ